jgi:hypothetical protein
VVVALAAGVVGGLIGNHMADTTAAAPPPAAAPPAPTPTQVNAPTIDLCTRFAAGYRAMPSPKNTAADVIPSYNYISEALRENPAAEGAIRNAVARSLTMARDQTSNFSHEPAAGAIRTNTTWTPEAANIRLRHHEVLHVDHQKGCLRTVLERRHTGQPSRRWAASKNIHS